jgi:hypothetical protein
MNKIKKLTHGVQRPDERVTFELNREINSRLEDYPNETKTLWLFILATTYYNDLEFEQGYELMDFQMAAERAVDDVSNNTE